MSNMHDNGGYAAMVRNVNKARERAGRRLLEAWEEAGITVAWAMSDVEISQRMESARPRRLQPQDSSDEQPTRSARWNPC